MSSNSDPNVIYVFVQDDPDETVTTEDILDWLGILDQIDDIKRAFDHRENQTGYAVRFKHPTGAHLAVSHLDGEKLKNHVIRINSNVYSTTKRSGEETESESVRSGAAVKTVTDGMDGSIRPVEHKERISAELPHNHLMPKEWKMSEPLLDVVKAVAAGGSEGSSCTWVDGKAVIEKLKALQEEWYETSVALERVQAQMKEANLQIRANHLFKPAQKPEGTPGISSNLTEDKFLLCTASPISFQKVSPAVLISTISEFFGPLERYSYEVNPTGLDFVLFFQLMMPEDTNHFLSVCLSKTEPSPDEKVTEHLCSVQWLKVPHALIGSNGTPTREALISLLQT